MGKLTYLARRLVNHARIFLLRRRGARVASTCRVGPGIIAKLGVGRTARGSIQIDEHVQLSTGAILEAFGGSITIAANTFLGPYVVVYGHGGVLIGANTLVSMHCRILSSNHTVPPPGALIRDQPDILLPTRLGNDVWLGAGVTVLGGVTIGDGCVVGAGAVVTRNIPPNSIAVGVPARVVASRSDHGTSTTPGL